MDVLTDTTSWSLLAGVVLPYLVAVVNRPWWSPNVRRAVSVACSVVGGLLVCLATGAFGDGSGVTIMGACLTVLIASQTVYAHLIRETVRKVEMATSPRRAAEPPRETFEGYDDTPGTHSTDRSTA